MNLLEILGLGHHQPDELPEAIRELRDIRGVRVIRLQGPVGKDIGAQAHAADQAATNSEAFTRPLLFDFKDATECDSATVAYLIRALRRRAAAHVPVGIVNAPPTLIAELEISKVGPLFRVFQTEPEAIKELTADATASNDNPRS